MEIYIEKYTIFPFLAYGRFPKKYFTNFINVVYLPTRKKQLNTQNSLFAKNQFLLNPEKKVAFKFTIPPLQNNCKTTITYILNL